MQLHSSGMMLGRVSYLNESPPSEVVVKRRDFMLSWTGAQHWLMPSRVVVRSALEAVAMAVVEGEGFRMNNPVFPAKVLEWDFYLFSFAICVIRSRSPKLFNSSWWPRNFGRPPWAVGAAWTGVEVQKGLFYLLNHSNCKMGNGPAAWKGL